MKKGGLVFDLDPEFSKPSDTKQPTVKKAPASRKPAPSLFEDEDEFIPIYLPKPKITSQPKPPDLIDSATVKPTAKTNIKPQNQQQPPPPQQQQPQVNKQRKEENPYLFENILGLSNSGESPNSRQEKKIELQQNPFLFENLVGGDVIPSLPNIMDNLPPVPDIPQDEDNPYSFNKFVENKPGRPPSPKGVKSSEILILQQKLEEAEQRALKAERAYKNLKEKESIETKILEDMIQNVESTLITTQERLSKAEKESLQLKKLLEQTNDRANRAELQVQKLSEQLQNHHRAPPRSGSVTEAQLLERIEWLDGQLQQVHQQGALQAERLKTVANTAENYLKQMITGCDQLRDMANHVASLDKFSYQKSQ